MILPLLVIFDPVVTSRSNAVDDASSIKAREFVGSIPGSGTFFYQMTRYW